MHYDELKAPSPRSPQASTRTSQHTATHHGHTPDEGLNLWCLHYKNSPPPYENSPPPSGGAALPHPFPALAFAGAIAPNCPTHLRFSRACCCDGRMDRPLTIAIVGAGQRGKTYSAYAHEHPDELRVVAVAEPRAYHRDVMRARFSIPGAV
jgi:hypothetical protein